MKLTLRAATVVVLLLLAAPLAAAAQQRGKMPRIGWLSVGSPPANPAFWQGMRDLGYVEGQNIVVEYRWAEGKLDRLRDLAAELTRLKVDVIVTNGYPAAVAAKHVTATIPVVFSTHVDPVGTGLVTSLARPAGNLTGLTLIAPDLVGKRLELMREAVPKVSRLAVLMNSANPGFEPTLKRAEVAAETLGLKLHIVEARTPGELDAAFSAISRALADGLHVNRDPLFLEHRARIVELVARSRLPAMYDVRQFVDAGGLMSYGPRLSDHMRGVATVVDKLLMGAKPTDLPVEQPARIELVLNLKTAKALGLTIPPSVLIRADEIIQ